MSHNIKTYTQFFELLQVAIGTRERLSTTLSPDEWEQLYVIAKEQTLTGIAFAALERLPQEQLPPPRRIRQWAVKADRIREKNKTASVMTAKVSDFFKQNGFHCLILKGQGNLYFYSPHLQELRSPGDIDVWAWPSGSNPVRTVIEFCQTRKKGAYMYYHNLDFPIIKDIPVEVHYRPTWLYNPWHNKHLQAWFNKYKTSRDFIEYDGYAIPSARFNTIFQLLHLYKHIFEEGIGLRQLLDYYMVLKEAPLSYPAHERMPFGLNKFAAAVMYVLREVFNAENRLMLCPPDEKRGLQLLEEIMQSGNFGQFDKRYNWKEASNGSLKYRGMKYAVTRLRHNMRFLLTYPSEVIFEPLFRIYNKLWIWLRLWKYE